MQACAAAARRPIRLQRLACFDSLVATLPKVEADRFGMTEEIANKRDPVAERQAQTEILPATIIAVGAGGHGELIFTLDNQQVWMQTQAEPGKHFAVGSRSTSSMARWARCGWRRPGGA